MGRKLKVDRKYTHFAVSIKLNKVVNGWDCKGLDKESIKYYCDIDMKDNFPDHPLKGFKIWEKARLIKSGLDPMTFDNWYKQSDYENL